MIRKKKISKQRRAWQIVKGHAVTKDRQKAQRDRRDAIVLKQVRQCVWERSSVCEATGAAGRDDDELHHVIKRSQTKKMLAEVRHSTRVCVRVSHDAHVKLEAGTLKMIPRYQAAGFDCDYIVVGPKKGQIKLVYRPCLATFPNVPATTRVPWFGQLADGEFAVVEAACQAAKP